MLFLVEVRLPIEPFNSRVRDGSAATRLQRILKETKPKAAYFTAQDGRRGGVLVYELTDASQIPAIAEPWFLQFDAEIEARPAMTPDDLGRAGLEALGKAWA
jgi:hypothetical protein